MLRVVKQVRKWEWWEFRLYLKGKSNIQFSMIVAMWWPNVALNKQTHHVGWTKDVFLVVSVSTLSHTCCAKAYPTLCGPMDCSLPGSFVHGTFQARILEWGAISIPGNLSDPKIEPMFLAYLTLAGRLFTVSASWEAASPKSVCVLVAQSCQTLCNPMDCSPPDSVHEILQARVLEWVTILFSRGSSWPGDRTKLSLIWGKFFTIWATREAKQVGVKPRECVSRKPSDEVS